MVTENELSELLKSHGWYLNWLTRYKTRYAYARRRVGKKLQTKYLITETRLDDLTEEDVLKRIQA